MTSTKFSGFQTSSALLPSVETDKLCKIHATFLNLSCFGLTSSHPSVRISYVDERLVSCIIIEGPNCCSFRGAKALNELHIGSHKNFKSMLHAVTIYLQSILLVISYIISHLSLGTSRLEENCTRLLRVAPWHVRHVQLGR